MSGANRHAERLAEWTDRGRVGTPPQAAATVVLVRDRESGLETLVLRKNSKIAFGGMWVFPGGRVDDEDRRLEQGDELAIARRAAVREALEETGLTVGEESLVPFSHWTPPPITRRRYLTWFFVARAPEAIVSIDGGEIHEHAWLRPADALTRRDAGEFELAPPTFVTLHELAGHRSVESALAHARARTPEHFATVVARVDGGVVAIWHGDEGYEDAVPDRPGARHRLWMLEQGWRYERWDSGGPR